MTRFTHDGLADLILQERDRWALWLPVGIGVGICLYFSAASEPPLWLGPSIVTMGGILLWSRHRIFRGTIPEITVMVSILLTVGTGITAAKIRTISVAAPVLPHDVGPTTITGRIKTVETFPVGARVILIHPSIAGLQPFQTPVKISLRLRGRQPDIWPGDWIQVRGKLSAPSPPVAPGAFDFQRQAYFREIGAVGFGFGAAKVIASAEQSGGTGISGLFARLRHRLSIEIIRTLPGASGGLAAALMTGQKRAVDDQTLQQIRDAGLAHLLSISGLHVGLVAGVLFSGLRLLLSVIPAIGLRYSVKKWAAGTAIVGAFCYALIAGATLPTQRAFLMLGLAMFAVIVDRRGISMRSLAWVASAVLLVQPESLMGPSFQMSFAAVMALIATYEIVTGHRTTWKPGHNRRRTLFHRAALYIAGVGLTTLVAGLATTPYSAFHFNRFADYSLLANLLAVPITALWVMPFAVLAFVLMPFGLHGLALGGMRLGLDGVLLVASTVSRWPGSVTLMPAMPDWGLVAISAGLIWLCLWQKPWRLYGIMPIMAGIGSVYFTVLPDVLIDGKGQLVAVVSDNGTMRFSSLTSGKFARETWLRRAGQGTGLTFTQNQVTGQVHLACDLSGCLYISKSGQRLAIAKTPDALLEDCWNVDVVVSLLPIQQSCPAPVVIDRFDLWRNGTYALWMTENGVKIRTTRDERGHRPWVQSPRARRPTANRKRS